ncbi:MAG: ABC transporter ATP-binding protein [Alphaproteobacteria bacterium]|nr:ABC transporter ATP-binding protein [Alphaproteobacteria bacterium]
MNKIETSPERPIPDRGSADKRLPHEEPAGERPAVQVDRLTKAYGPVRAVDGISFDLYPGETVALLGGNGAGKTTTLSMILGLLKPSSGSVTVLGHDMSSRPIAALSRMNFASPYVDLPQRLTIAEMLLIYTKLYGIRKGRRRVEETLERFDLVALRDRPLGKLSAGQKTRAGLAKAHINEPDVLVLDEPTASLDPDTGDRIRGDLETTAKVGGAAILLASHNMDEVMRLADRVLMMRAGRIVDEGAPRELVDRHGRRDLEEVFLAIARDQTGHEHRETPDGEKA